ncbi:hypothetical protein [Synechococcus sp. PCC 6312]|uniref:hypothetical protein n=1 Tax=Synechococcus sp. (strain ATCC 27167 / PCC 6312) TaxID=195253 RepID=UPI00029F1156|nr:hypothetical protein [Synechococcus sp. PCC 6312]AFY61801.1 hypothetical protein Syn6312_2718 [Synechococcus sp. PCC 6312]
MDNCNSPESNEELVDIINRVQALVQARLGDSEKLLELLRVLEQLHRDIRDYAFQSALPKNRQALYKLLRTIEKERGWPYIPVMPLGEFCRHLEEDVTPPAK